MAASFEDILQERTHKYRRSLMAICVILIAIYWLPNLEFKDLALFGIKPKEAGYQARHLVLLALWILWLYHAILFWFYVQRDWKDWRSDLRAEGGHAFPEILMYFGRHPTEVTTRERVNDVEEWSWSLSTTRTNAEWIATLTFGTLMTCLTCAQRATLEAFSVEARNKPGREWYCRWGACPAKEGGRMTYILFILAMGPMSATGIYNPQVVDRHHRCLAEPGSFEAIYCSTIAPTPHPRWAKKQAAR